MSNKVFTAAEIEILGQNQYIRPISEKSITYTDEFRRKFIVEHEQGKNPREIFEEHGFDINSLGTHRVRSASKRWRAAHKENGVLGLEDARKTNSGRPSTKNLSMEEKFARLQAQNLLLKAENELLKKIDIAERRLSRKK